MDNQYYLLACNRIKDFGPRRIALCMENWPNLADLFRASVVELQQVGLPKQVAQSIKTFDFSGVDEDMIWLNKNPNHHVLTLGAPHYPRLLAEIYDPPPVLYARGELRCLDQALLAMVGSRQPSVMGEETAWRFAHELAQAHVTIVSGLAMGIDAQAHRGCLSAGGATIAVMGTGMNIIYPRQHQDLAEKIVENGLLMSEFPLNTSPNAGHFPRRNRIIYGLS